MSIHAGHKRYPYTTHLKELDRRRPGKLEWLKSKSSPLVVEEWERQLKYHPDGEYKEYLLTGLRRGFRIGFDYGSHRCRSAKTNMKSALQNPAVVDRYLATEVGLGRILGPLEPSSLPLVVINRFGKSHQPGRWRLIVDLSHPNGWSVNDGIQPELCSLSYTSVDEALHLILPLGPGTQLAKFDIESAYRLVMVHPDDRHLLGMKWKDQLFVDTVIPFDLPPRCSLL